MASLQVLVSEANIIEQKLIESDGEITEEIELMLSIRSENLADKVDSYAVIIERFKAIEEFYAEKAEKIKQIAKNCNYVQKRLKKNIEFAMSNLGTDEISGNESRFKLQRSQSSLLLSDEDQIPMEYKNPVTTYVVDKDKIKAEIKAGKDLPFASMVENFSLRTYSATPKSIGAKK